MALKVPLSFKESEKEMHNFLIKQLSPSIYIKQLLKNEMEKGSVIEKPTISKNNDLLDF